MNWIWYHDLACYAIFDFRCKLSWLGSWCLYLTDLYGNNDDNNDHGEDVIGVINSTPFTEKGVK